VVCSGVKVGSRERYMTVIIARWLVGALSFLLVAYFLDGVEIGSFYIALVLTLLWGILSVTVKPILYLITLPINFLTLGLFSFVLNALLLVFLASFVDGFQIDGFLSALMTAFLLAIFSWAGNILIDAVSKNNN